MDLLPGWHVMDMLVFSKVEISLFFIFPSSKLSDKRGKRAVWASKVEEKNNLLNLYFLLTFSVESQHVSTNYVKILSHFLR